MNFQQALVVLAIAVTLVGFSSHVSDITGYSVMGPEMQKGGAIAEAQPIAPLYTNDTSGWCECNSCSDCANALNDNENCTVGVKLTQNITSTGTCIDNPANFSNKTFDCQFYNIAGDASGEGIVASGGGNWIENCVISNFSAGINLTSGANNISSCNITNNTVGLWTNIASLNVWYNNIWDNVDFGINNSNASMNVNAASNWWNTLSPSQSDTPPAEVSENVTLGEVLVNPILIDTPMLVVSPINNSYVNSSIYFEVHTNRNSTCKWGTSPTTITNVMTANGGLNYTATITASTEGNRVYYLSCLNDIGETYNKTINITVDLTLPTLAGIKINNLNSTGIGISWNTSENTTAVVWYDTSTSYGNSITDSNLVKEHTAHLTGLSAGIPYYFQIVAYDRVGNNLTTTDYYFVTEETKVFDIATNNATVTFTSANLVFFINATPSTSRSLIASEMIIAPATPLSITPVMYFNLTPDSTLVSILNWTYINYTYDEAAVTAMGIAESNLRIYKYSGGSWNVLPGGVNATENYVWANTTSFSYFAVGGTLSNGANCTSDSQCNSTKCLTDYDTVGAWCGPTTSCSHDGAVNFALGTTVCYGNYTVRCDGGYWTSNYCYYGCDSSTHLCVTETGGGGGGGGGGAPSGAGISTAASFAVLTPGLPSIISISNNSFDIDKIIINVNQTITGGSSVTIKQFFAKPSGVTTLNNTYAYLSLSVQNIPYTYLDEVTIEFTVNSSWITSNNIDEDSVTLQHYISNWTTLNTTKIGAVDDKIKYSAVTPTFSYFAITGRAVGGAATYCGDDTCDADENCSSCEIDCGACQTASVCGDGTCASDETCTNCEQDCGACPPPAEAFCGNAVCEEGESSDTCPDDCPAEEAPPAASTGISPIIIIGAVAGMFIAIIAVFWFVIRPRIYEQNKMVMRQEKPEEKYQPEVTYFGAQQTQPAQQQSPQQTIDSYIQRQVQRGVSDLMIRNALLKAGWKEEQVISAFRRMGRQ